MKTKRYWPQDHNFQMTALILLHDCWDYLDNQSDELDSGPNPALRLRTRLEAVIAQLVEAVIAQLEEEKRLTDAHGNDRS